MKSKRKFTVREHWKNNRVSHYSVAEIFDWLETSGIGWVNRGEPCSYKDACHRVSVLNKGK